MTGIHADQMGLVTVLGVLVGPVMVPLLQAPRDSYLVFFQIGQDSLYALGKFGISQLERRFTGIGEAFPDNGQIGRGAVDRASFVPVWIFVDILG